MTTVTTTQNTQRVIFQCKNRTCKHVWAKEYRKCLDPKTGEATGNLYYMVEVNGMRIRHFYGDDINGRCPQCNSLFIEGNKVEGKVTEHVCNAKCMSAKSGQCECSCGGANHGCSYL